MKTVSLSDDNKQISLNIDAINKDQVLKTKFLNAVEDYLVFDYLKDLRYKQYGLNDYFWSLKGIREKYPISKENLRGLTKKQHKKKVNPIINVTIQDAQPITDTKLHIVDQDRHTKNLMESDTDYSFSQFEGICQPTSTPTIEESCEVCYFKNWVLMQ